MIPIATILVRFGKGMSVREVATQHGLAVPLARALWEAEVLGGNAREVPVCSACGGGGSKDGVPCKACLATGMGAGS